MNRPSANRREFGKQVVTLAATPFVVDAISLPAAAQADAGAVQTEALFAVTQARYGKFLTPAQLVEVKTSIARNQKMADLLRQVKLDNGDGPANVFRADLP